MMYQLEVQIQYNATREGPSHRQPQASSSEQNLAQFRCVVPEMCVHRQTHTQTHILLPRQCIDQGSVKTVKLRIVQGDR